MMNPVRSFLEDRRGATAAMFAVAVVPIIGTLAIAADYSSVMRQRVDLQQVVDSTATALARDTDILLLNAAALNARALSYANAVSGALPVANMALQASANADQISVSASGEAKLIFAKILGADSLLVTASVTVDRAKTKTIELALVLDNTGSMAGAKIAQLKLAVKGLVDFLADPKKNKGPTKIALVPFTTYVRTDPAWMTNAMLESSAPKGWTGCVTDRDQPNDTTDTTPTGGTDTKFWWRKNVGGSAVNCGSLAKIIPLTSDLPKIKTAANTMIASGATNVPIGVVWGMHALTGGSPLTEGSPEGTKDLLRAMIVLTDGQNTQNRWTSNQGQIDARLTLACNNAKAKGIVVYTIRLIDGNEKLLKACATSFTHYYSVSNASQLTPVFEQIASSLSKMRISK